jgi:hypothetical protein
MDENASWPGIPPFPSVEEIERLRRDNEEVSAAFARWERGVAEIERKIDRPSSRDLDTLTRAGAVRKTLVHLLALTASKGGSKWWKELMRRRQDALRHLAKRMETLATLAEKQSGDVTYRSKLYFYLLGGGGVIGMEEPKPLKEVPGVGFVISGMRVLAKTFRDEAKQMTLFLRHSGQTDSGLVHLLVRVFLWTHQSSDRHYDELARLLTDAFEAAGKKDVFSADQLRKIWSRHGKGMLQILVKLQTEPVPEEHPISSVEPAISPLGLSPKLDSEPQD